MLVLFCCSCSKKENNSNPSLCFKGKYVGQGCWPVIQILEPLDGRFKDSSWGTSTIIYNNTVGVGTLHDRYKDGAPFYFTISKVDSNIVHTANCSVPKYYIVIDTYSDNTCKILTN